MTVSLESQLAAAAIEAAKARNFVADAVLTHLATALREFRSLVDRQDLDAIPPQLAKSIRSVIAAIDAAAR